MPPRYAYWTIIAGGLPTAFRAADRDELLPTFQRLRQKHADAVMKWFARGKLWSSPEEARAAGRRDRVPTRNGPQQRAAGTPHSRDRRPAETRGRDWRPGGDHRDPRQKYADAKKARNQERRKQRFERKHAGARPFRSDSGTKPGGRDRPRGPFQRERPPEVRDRPRSGQPKPTFASRRERPRFEPPGDRAGGRPPRKPGARHPAGPSSGGRTRPFAPRGFVRGQQHGTDEARPPKRPRGPNREPRPSENPEPTPPPRPSEPAIMPPGPPERGRRGEPDER